MANTNVQNFLTVLALQLLNYGAAKLTDKNTQFAPTRSAIYMAGLQSLNQEVQDRLVKSQATITAAQTNTTAQ